MTLQDLIDELSTLLPTSARGATVSLQEEYEELSVSSVSYEDGKVIIRCERVEGESDDDERAEEKFDDEG